ncbi:MAG TPA: FmdB family zinc ribbon protein [Roseiflexaceae bacterium]|nr:FmdB family zinc ribbon protein [Roseiflexaceae bacterium]
MPTYVYACDTCGAQFEQFQSFKDEPVRTCPSCAGAVRRVFQPVGIVFKGSGWYITDSRKSGSASVGSDDSAGKAEKAAAGDTAAKGEAKSEGAAKSETASEAKSGSESKPTT